MPGSLTYVNTVATLGAAGGVYYLIVTLMPRYAWLALWATLIVLLVGFGVVAWLHFQPKEL
jgi:hypothetical protein